MAPGKMHVDEVATDEALVRRLLAAQFPQWANLPIRFVASSGTDNAIYRLGDDMAVRLPRLPASVPQVDKEHHWLEKFAPLLPLAIPTPLAKGSPGEGYPWNWSVYRWLDGENVTAANVPNMAQAALDLAQFILALHRIDQTGGPPPGPHNFGRGAPLAERDAATRGGIAALKDAYDPALLTAIWETALAAPVWDGPPVWIHGDIQPGNLLVQNGRLSAVIDFGAIGVGDPACDLLVAWNFLTAETRQIFRAALAVDNAPWARGQGWALSVAVIALPYYHLTNPGLAENSRRVIAEVTADFKRG